MDRPASPRRVPRHPLVLAGSDEPASRARAVRHPMFLFRGCRCLCRLCSLARPPLSYVCAAPGRALVFVAACCCAPRPPTPPNPGPLLRLLSAAAPFASWRRRARRRLFRPPPPWGCVSGPLASYSAFSLVPSVPCGSSAPLGCLSAPPAAPAPPPIPGFVFRGCRCPAARLPLFSLYLLVVSHQFAVCPPPPVPPCCVSWVSFPYRSFSRVLVLFPFFFRALGLGTCLVGFPFPPLARVLSCALCAVRWCPPPPPAVAPGDVRCPASCCVVPRLGVGCYVRRAVFFCTMLCWYAGALLCGVLFCCGVGFVAGRLPLALAALFLLVSHSARLCSGVLCRVSSCVPPSCVVVCCGVFFVAVVCRGGGLVLALPSRFCAPAGLCRLVLPPPPPGLCVVPCAGWCCRAVLACSVLCGAVLLLAVLCGSGCGVPGHVLPCLVVLREWCGAALRFLVRLRPAACSAVLGGAVLCCRALRRSLGCCILVLCAVLSRCVLLSVALCRLVPVSVVRLAVCCAVLCCVALLFAAVCCAAPLSVVSGCAVLCCPRCGLLFRLGRGAVCCAVPPGAVLTRVASRCAVWCSAVVHCAVGMVLCCVVSRCVVPFRAVACPQVLCGASGAVCFAACCAVLCCAAALCAVSWVWCLGALCCAVGVVSCCLVGVCVPVCCAASLGSVLRCVALCRYVPCSAVAHCAVCVVLCCFFSRFLVLLRAVPCPRCCAVL